MGECILARTASNIVGGVEPYCAIFSTSSSASGGIRGGYISTAESSINAQGIAGGSTYTVNTELQLFTGSNNAILSGTSSGTYVYNVFHADVLIYANSGSWFIQTRLYPDEPQSFVIDDEGFSVVLTLTDTLYSTNKWYVNCVYTNNSSVYKYAPNPVASIIWVGEKV